MDLKPQRKLSQEDWLQAPETVSVMDALHADEKTIIACFVGGAVRNSLLGVPVADIDLCTVLTPDVVVERLEKAGLKAIPTGIDHGTVTAVTDGKSFEITTLRKDVETDGRHAVIAYSTDWKEDASRRDFTMNTLLADRDGNVYDPLGCGVEDAKAGRVIFVGEPAQRIAEDVLRILRFFRFHSFYGQGAPDQDALFACAAQAHKIETLSKERVTQEFVKILSSSRAEQTLGQMFDNKVLLSFLFSEYEEALLKNLIKRQNDCQMMSVVARVAVLSGLNDDNAEKIFQALRLSRANEKHTKSLIKACTEYKRADMHGLKTVLYFYGREIAKDWLLIQADSLDLWEAAKDEGIPVFLVSGEDLIKEGFKPGSELGEELRRRERAWIDSDFS